MSASNGWGAGNRIAISLVTARPEPLTGIGRYVESVLAGLSAGGYRGSVTLFVTDGSPLPALGLPPAQVDISWFRSRRSSIYCLLWHIVALPRLAKRSGADLLHVANLKPVPPVGVRLAVTVHDSAELEVASRFDPLRTMYRRLLFYPLTRRADVVLSVSDSARRPVARALRRAPCSIRVVPNTVDATRFVPAAARSAKLPPLPKRFVLYVGRIEHPNKNLINLFRAFAIVHERYSDVLLVVAGTPSWRADEVFHELKQTAGAHYVGYVPEEALPGLYAAAEVLVLPSFHEGFGIPVLEAMACGTPVAAANAGALPEITGNAAELFDPADVNSIASALSRLVADSTLRDRLVARGRRRVACFAPEMIGDALRQVYEPFFSAT